MRRRCARSCSSRTSAEIRRFVRTALEAEGFEVSRRRRAAQGLIEAGTRKPDLVVLDLGLPDGDGVDFIRDLRAWSRMPIIVLSARTRRPTRSSALDAGADDYLPSRSASASCSRACARRCARMRGGADGSATFRFGDVEVDLAAPHRRKGGAAGAPHARSSIRLLALLSGNPGRVLTHRQILREVWGPSHGEDKHYVRVYMGHLRKKVERSRATRGTCSPRPRSATG